MNRPIVTFLDNGIMCVEYPMHAAIKLRDVEDEYRQRLAISENKHPLLVKLHGMAAFEDKAQLFLGSEAHGAITSAAGIVLDPDAGYQELSRILLDLLQHYTRQHFEIKIFDNEKDATEWPMNYL